MKTEVRRSVTASAQSVIHAFMQACSRLPPLVVDDWLLHPDHATISRCFRSSTSCIGVC